ncbi:MAG: glutathione S-transferase family protein, partial [Deltaproteobacteria bacterium]|nr:glutathione S-transferase family protein [Deltaproteobacteria bacterium]
MHEIILHHYELSPYAEKVRLALGLKGLAWRSVQIPIVMPKPDLIELTGGYRRTPVMQLGADIYCDTKACMRLLQRLQPEPSLFPGGDEATVWGLSRWAETSFMMAVTVFLGAGGVFNEKFIEDRKKMAPHLDFSKTGVIVPAKLLQLRANLDLLERQLADGRLFLLGDQASLADLSAYHPHRFLNGVETTRALLEPLTHVSAWLVRV